jgi:hypothetical protein
MKILGSLDLLVYIFGASIKIDFEREKPVSTKYTWETRLPSVFIKTE